MKKEQIVYSETTIYRRPLKEFIQQLTDAANAYSDEDIRVNIEAEYDGDSTYGLIQLVFDRDETSDERSKRLKQEKDWNDRRIADAKKLLGIT